MQAYKWVGVNKSQIGKQPLDQYITKKSISVLASRKIEIRVQ
jgi:hypothetical protein